MRLRPIVVAMFVLPFWDDRKVSGVQPGSYLVNYNGHFGINGHTQSL